jgi:cytochrome c oxidase assembly protein subunit 15
MSENTSRAFRIWLYMVAALVALMVMVGGATRLTESGLSITEWKPITGVLPPLGKWNAEFEKYQTTTQYKELNRGMALAEFKKIYWWEWTHRFLGRLIAVAFAFPLLLFGLTRDIPRPLMIKLGGILALGALQGVVGWWMVASGLAERINVAPYRLAIHLTLGLAIFAGLIEVAQEITSSRQANFSHPAKILLAFIFLQIFLGGLVAGNRAGYVYNTWPLMDGSLVPSGLLGMQPWWRNFFENTALVQFLHRMTAYVLLLFGLVIFFKERSRETAWLLIALILQAGLGIAALLSGMNFTLALAHQAGIIIVLSIAMTQLRDLKNIGEKHG